MAVSLVAYRLAVADSLALGVGRDPLRLRSSAAWRCVAPADVDHPRHVRHHRGAIGLAYALRAIGDVGSPALSWLSPIGWYQAMHAFSGLRWWPALLRSRRPRSPRVAYAVFDRRDYGTGVFAARPGPAARPAPACTGAGPCLAAPAGAVIGWTVGLALVGLSTARSATTWGRHRRLRPHADLIGGPATCRRVLRAMLMLALIARGFAISSALRPRGEEDAGRVEALLATALPRRAWLAGHVG